MCVRELTLVCVCLHQNKIYIYTFFFFGTFLDKTEYLYVLYVAILSYSSPSGLLCSDDISPWRSLAAYLKL